jgi:hypothetical protein
MTMAPIPYFSAVKNVSLIINPIILFLD